MGVFRFGCPKLECGVICMKNGGIYKIDSKRMTRIATDELFLVIVGFADNRVWYYMFHYKNNEVSNVNLNEYIFTQISSMASIDIFGESIHRFQESWLDGYVGQISEENMGKMKEYLQVAYPEYF